MVETIWFWGASSDWSLDFLTGLAEHFIQKFGPHTDICRLYKHLVFLDQIQHHTQRFRYNLEPKLDKNTIKQNGKNYYGVLWIERILRIQNRVMDQRLDNLSEPDCQRVTEVKLQPIVHVNRVRRWINGFIVAHYSHLEYEIRKWEFFWGVGNDLPLKGSTR